MCSTCVETERRCPRERLFNAGSSLLVSPHEKDYTVNLTGFPDLRLPLCHDELDPPEELVVGSPFEADLLQRHEADDVPVVISKESSLTSLLRYWREAKDGDFVIAAPSLPDPRFFTAPKTPPAPFPSFAKYATSLPPPPLFDHELIAAPTDDLPQPFRPVLIPDTEDEILLNLPDLQRLEAIEGEIVPAVLNAL